MRTREEYSKKDILTPGQRLGEGFSIVIMCCVIGFFVYHQVAQTGFFTAAFGSVGIVCFYGPMLLSLAAPMARAVIGRRNPARLLEVVTNVSMALGAYWLLQAFPFDFTHLADALPEGIRFAFAWINNDLGRIPFLLQVIVCPLAALVTGWIYLSVRLRASAHAASS